jgi:fatty-acyl-CoA synthase
MIRAGADRQPDVVAVDDGVRRLTAAGLVDRAERLANALEAAGAHPGTPIGVLSENRAAYVETDVAIAFLRGVRVALNARLHLDEHRFVAADSGMRVLLHSARFDEEASALRDDGVQTISLDEELDQLITAASSTRVERQGDGEDPAWITYTSGTTGKPKGVVLSQRAIVEVARNLIAEFGPIGEGDVIVLPQPLSHGAGYFVLPWVASSGGVYVMRGFDPEEVLAVGARPEARILKCVPAMLPPLLEQAAAAAFGYGGVIYGASPIPRPVLGEALERFGPILSQIYGQSEAPVTITCLPADAHADDVRRFSAGRPFERVRLEVRGGDGETLGPGEIGEVAVTGPHLMTRYHGLPEATAAVFENGWVMTRDLGFLDESGYLHLRGRSDEMIISGGYNISPREVEIALGEFPGVEEVAVAGVPDVEWGTAVTAMVKFRGETSATPGELVTFAKARLGFRTPKFVTVVDAIPKNAYGKVDRLRVLASLTQARDQQRSTSAAAPL